MWIYISKNLYWLVPTIITGVFSLLLFIVARKQHKIQKQSMEIIEEQKNIQKQSVKISDEQKEIQRENVKLALFDKRYDIYLKMKCQVF